MAENKQYAQPQELKLVGSQAARLADELVSEPIAMLELRVVDLAKGKQAQPAYALQRNQALTRGRSGYSNACLPKEQLNDSNLGRGETSAQLVAHRLA